MKYASSKVAYLIAVGDAVTLACSFPATPVCSEYVSGGLEPYGAQLVVASFISQSTAAEICSA